jgi:hypothetical protein
VTIDRVRIGEWIYWPLVYITQNYTLQITDTQTSVFSLLQSPLGVSWQWLLAREILKLPALRSSCHSCLCRTLCQLTSQLTESRLATISHQPPSLLFTGCLPTDNWTLSFTNQLLHVTSLNWIADNSLTTLLVFSYITSGQTQHKTLHPTVLLLLSWALA